MKNINWNREENEAIVEQSEIRSSVATLASLINLIQKNDSMKLERIEVEEDGHQCRVFYLVDTETY